MKTKGLTCGLHPASQQTYRALQPMQTTSPQYTPHATHKTIRVRAMYEV